MKRLFVLIVAAVLSLGMGARAQNSLLDALKGAATAAADKATGGALTAKTIVGTWNYARPGIRLTSDDALSDVAAAAAAAAVGSKMAKYYEMAGIKEGACRFVLNDDGTFSSTFGAKMLSGTYTFEASDHTLSLKYSAGKINLGSVPAKAYMNGADMQILFPADWLLDVVTKLGAAVDSFSSVKSLLEKYDGVSVGFEFRRE